MSIWQPGRLAIHALLGAVLWGGLAALGASRDARWAILAAAVGAAVHGWLVLKKPLRRARALREPMPEAWRSLLERRITFYRLLPDDERLRFEQNVRVFLADYRFEAVGNVELDDELRLYVASGAATIMHGRPDWTPPGKRTVLIYPDRFQDDYNVGSEGNILGMVHHQGPMIFSAKSLRHGFKDDDDGHNVALHELAHVLDLDDGAADGVPATMRPEDLRAWSEAAEEEMRKVHQGKSVLRSYAGTNDAELFAVAVEGFFERPHAMKRRAPALYEALAGVFALDPVELDRDAKAAGRGKSDRPRKKKRKGKGSRRR